MLAIRVAAKEGATRFATSVFTLAPFLKCQARVVEMTFLHRDNGGKKAHPTSRQAPRYGFPKRQVRCRLRGGRWGEIYLGKPADWPSYPGLCGLHLSDGEREQVGQVGQSGSRGGGRGEGVVRESRGGWGLGSPHRSSRAWRPAPVGKRSVTLENLILAL